MIRYPQTLSTHLSITCIENKVIQNLDFKDVTSDFANATLTSLAYPLAYAYSLHATSVTQPRYVSGVKPPLARVVNATLKK